ncbi:MAG: hypothetical protein IJE59_01355 [Clostridia bacterium]|nr:hypothetical protein [Clostridia bacterium]
MKKITFEKLIITFIFVFLVILNTNVYASNFNTSLEIDSINQENIVLLLKLKDVNFENTISTIEGNLEYDKEIFLEASIENLNGWSIVYNNEEKANGKFLGFKISDEQIISEDLCKITLKLKENVKESNTQIIMRNIKSADGDKLVSTEDKVINISVDNGEIIAEKQKDKMTEKSMLKYLLLIVELVLIVTAISSIIYLIQKNRMKKLYEGSRPRNK